MTWQGIDRGITSVSEDMGASEYQQNTRMTVRGELQRRPGMAPANFSPQGTAALGMVGAFPTSGPYGMIVDTSGTVNGFPITMPIWQPPQLKPPIPQDVPQGNQWVFNDNHVAFGTWVMSPTLCGVTTLSAACSGVIRIHCTASVGTVTVIRRLGGATLVIDSRTPSADYSVTIPFSATLPEIEIQGTGIDSYLYLISGESKSDAGCGPQWGLYAGINFTFTVQSSATSRLTCLASDCACPGKVTASFPSVTSVGATASIWRSNGAGRTIIIDSRSIVSGTEYTVNVPATVAGSDTTRIHVEVNITDGLNVTGSFVGQATAGCG